MAAINGKPLVSTRGMTPTEAVLWHSQELGSAMTKLIDRVAVLEKENVTVRGQLDDALDYAHSLERELGAARARAEELLGERSAT